ncbi:sodium:calcium antiporter [Haloterrigena sp. SYSU A558-1]|uniref:Sodium:calcium antiporter n=1 Tax=Haloterrigena gelatinilytica TaxID=2741724 RepID=A0A8J8GMB3_9EURY|nr:sodium:calcium antiporter [Haloterrigena gelatinilytica]NUB92296.1 sodium:calcium antiporter [Haloterrigena gelatinilytica]NUC71879.1 sodium:calcium antiporter [Haloterrigena gelatinilytica]
MSNRSLGTIGAAAALTLPWMLLWATTDALPALGFGPTFGGLSTLGTVAASGVSILGAAFLLAWAAETAEKDVPRAFAIAVLAVLAVAPEYAVDALYAWNAGQFAGTERGIEAGNLAVANMTGANRILIGLGWSGIALFTVFRRDSREDPAVINRDGYLRDSVRIDPDISLEIVFLLLATLWAFLVPLNGGIDALDMAFLVGLYVAYIAIILRGDVEPNEMHTGVPAYLQSFSKPKRIASVVGLFAYSGLVIFVAVEPFAHGLEDLGTEAGIPPFFMIQWIAPLASESPELIVVAYLVNKTRSTAGFNALISSKLNQWTLLIGTLVVVYSLALGQYGALPFDQKQMGEIWLTAAQSFFAIALLIDFEVTAREAVALLVLFVSQVLLEFAVIREVVTLPISTYQMLLVYSAVYIVLGLALFVHRRSELRRIVERTGSTISSAVSGRERPHGADD